jgi:peptidoglycan/xylan/chitin deacetylase (PgdA/CDA1 family)
MSLDRIVTLLAYRAIGPFGRRRETLPVLMYHSISATPEDAPAYYRTCTDPMAFAEQMSMLASDGYQGLTLTEGLAALDSGNAQLKSRKPVAITFDDGYHDFLTSAVPALQRHAFTATMYLPTGFIAHERRQFKGRDCLTWPEIADLHGCGFEFGSHTVTHPKLVDLTLEEIRNEVIVSKSTIEQQLSTEVKAFAYPYAFPQHKRDFVRRFVDVVATAGYRSAVTTMIGHVRAQDDVFCLKRLPVNSCDDADLLRAKLQGFYNWMAAPQSAAKQLARVMLG